MNNEFKEEITMIFVYSVIFIFILSLGIGYLGYNALGFLGFFTALILIIAGYITNY